MALYDLNRTKGLPLGTGIVAAFVNRVDAIIDWDRSRRTRTTLASLSDHQLRDIGVERGEIHTRF